MTRLYTATERKNANRQALALLTASANPGFGRPVGVLIECLGSGLPLVTLELLSLVSGLLAGLDEDNAGACDRWLRCCGSAVEAMPEGGE